MLNVCRVGQHDYHNKKRTAMFEMLENLETSSVPTSYGFVTFLGPVFLAAQQVRNPWHIFDSVWFAFKRNLDSLFKFEAEVFPKILTISGAKIKKGA